MEHKVIHFEIQGRDGKRSQEFYASLFGWKIDANNPMKYGMVDAEAPGIRGGICEAMGPPLVTFYVSADDLAATLKKVERLGGKTVMQPQQVPDGPEIALFSDLDGNVVGLVRMPARHRNGAYSAIHFTSVGRTRPVAPFTGFAPVAIRTASPRWQTI